MSGKLELILGVCVSQTCGTSLPSPPAGGCGR